jgi:hypothetical protein
MTYVKKRSNLKVYIAIIAVIVLVIAGFAAIYLLNSGTKPVGVGVRVGDTFTYSIMGTSEFADPTNTSDTPGFDQYNQTDYFKITITDVTGTNVSMDASWHFLNGTQQNYRQTVDLASGNKSDASGFWAIYPSNLTATELLRPLGADGRVVNKTISNVYASGNREINFWFINNQFYDSRDTSYGTQMYDYRNIYFDKITGMLTSYDEYQVFNNPQMQEVISWRLVSTSVWDV